MEQNSLSELKQQVNPLPQANTKIIPGILITQSVEITPILIAQDLTPRGASIMRIPETTYMLPTLQSGSLKMS
jgi:hypothetical protein